MSVSSFFRFFHGGISRPQRSLTTRHRVKPTVEVLEDRQLLSGLGGLGFFLASNRVAFDPVQQPAPIAAVPTASAAAPVVHADVAIAPAQVPVAIHPAASSAPATPTKQAVVVDGTADPTTPSSTSQVSPSASTGAATQTVQVNFGSATTDWSATKGLAQFNPNLGTLTGVQITNAGTLTSHIRVESLDNAPADVTGTVSGDLTLTGAVLASPLVTTTNAETETFHAGAFDGQSDFGGTSGQDFGNKSSDGSQTLVLNDAADLAKFTGLGQVPLTETAHATSSAAGAGNLLTQINSTAQASVTVLYDYIPAPVTVTGIPDNPTVDVPTTPLSKRMFLASTFRRVA